MPTMCFKKNRCDFKMNSISNTFYKVIPTPFKSLAIVWTNTSNQIKIQRVFISNEKTTADQFVDQVFPYSMPASCDQIDEVAAKIERFLKGESIVFNLEVINLGIATSFQKKVLLAEHGVPRGWITTYQRLAAHLSNPNGSRAVGNALKNNPFPIIIPCHRAIRSDGLLGGFQGGMKMKRALLEMEGIEFSGEGKVLTKNYFY